MFKCNGLPVGRPDTFKYLGLHFQLSGDISLLITPLKAEAAGSLAIALAKADLKYLAGTAAAAKVAQQKACNYGLWYMMRQTNRLFLLQCTAAFVTFLDLPELDMQAARGSQVQLPLSQEVPKWVAAGAQGHYDDANVSGCWLLLLYLLTAFAGADVPLVAAVSCYHPHCQCHSACQMVLAASSCQAACVDYMV